MARSSGDGADVLEERIGEWRRVVGRVADGDRADGAALEAQLRSELGLLTAAGLTADEAFLVGLRRVGAGHTAHGEYARRYAGSLWDEPAGAGAPAQAQGRRAAVEALAFAVAAAVAVVVTRLLAGWPGTEAQWWWRNAGLLVAFPVGYFAVRRRLGARPCAIAAVPFAVGALTLNLYPFVPGGSTEVLAATHLPLVLWAVVGYSYGSASWRSAERRAAFVRFSGEWAVHLALLAIGGAVLMGLTAGVLVPAGIDPQPVVRAVIPPGVAGAVIIAAWLAEARRDVVGALAPVLTTVFTPLFAVMLLVAAVVYVSTGLQGGFDRDILALFDLLLVVVLGLVLYGTSAAGPGARADWMDALRLVAVAGGLLLDGIVLVAMLGRVGDLGFTANRVAALGLNLLLLVDLAGTAWWSLRLLAGRDDRNRLERWQMAYLPLFVGWAAAVVVVLPVVFRFR